MKPKQDISAENAIDLIKNGLALVDLNISGEIKLDNEIYYKKEISINNCTVEYFDLQGAATEKPIRFTNTHFKNCDFTLSYFYEGLIIENCVFDAPLNFSLGGRNKIGYPIKLENNTFSGFVDFFHCWYNGEVIVTNNNFLEGTNIAGNGGYLIFDIPPTIADNIGKIDFAINLNV